MLEFILFVKVRMSVQGKYRVTLVVVNLGWVDSVF